MTLTLRVKRLSPEARLPTKSYPDDAAFDLYALDETLVTNGRTTPIRTGIVVEIPLGYCLVIRDRSGLATQGVHTLAGVIDAGFRGEVKVLLHSVCRYSVTKVRAGDRIAQALLLPVPECRVEEVQELRPSVRDAGGFGSTGR